MRNYRQIYRPIPGKIFISVKICTITGLWTTFARHSSHLDTYFWTSYHFNSAIPARLMLLYMVIRFAEFKSRTQMTHMTMGLLKTIRMTCGLHPHSHRPSFLRTWIPGCCKHDSFQFLCQKLHFLLLNSVIARN